ncbi:hypothetical protein P8610_05410 [Fictibacillus sp. UD]
MCNDNIAIQIIKKLGTLFEEYRMSKCEKQRKKLVHDIQILGEKLEEIQ